MFLTGAALRPSPTVREVEVPAGYAGTLETIRWMLLLTADAARDESVIRLAQSIVAQVPRRDYEAEARVLLTWVQRNLRYVRDPLVPAGIQRVTDPRTVLFDTGAEKCVGLSMTLCALAAAVGFAWGFRVVGTDPMAPNFFKHVYSLIYVEPHGFVPADPMFENQLGWEPPSDDPRASPTSARRGTVAYRRDFFP